MEDTAVPCGRPDRWPLRKAGFSAFRHLPHLRQPPAGDSFVRAPSVRGIGLVEVLVAAALFATLAAGVAHLFATSARSLVLARHRTSSLMLATDKIEQLRAGAGPWGSATGAGPAQAEFLSAGGHLLGRGGAAPSGTVYRRVASARRHAGQPGMLIVEVRVAVTGRGGDRASRGAAPHEVLVVTLLPVREAP